MNEFEIDVEINNVNAFESDVEVHQPKKVAIEEDVGTSGTYFHDELVHRDEPNQHPIQAISGLQNALDNHALKSDLDKFKDSENLEMQEIITLITDRTNNMVEMGD